MQTSFYKKQLPRPHRAQPHWSQQHLRIRLEHSPWRCPRRRPCFSWGRWWCQCHRTPSCSWSELLSRQVTEVTESVKRGKKVGNCKGWGYLRFKGYSLLIHLVWLIIIWFLGAVLALLSPSEVPYDCWDRAPYILGTQVHVIMIFPNPGTLEVWLWWNSNQNCTSLFRRHSAENTSELPTSASRRWRGPCSSSSWPRRGSTSKWRSDSSNRRRRRPWSRRRGGRGTFDHE